MIETDRPQTTI